EDALVVLDGSGQARALFFAALLRALELRRVGGHERVEDLCRLLVEVLPVQLPRRSVAEDGAPDPDRVFVHAKRVRLGGIVERGRAAGEIERAPVARGELEVVDLLVRF